jgi:Ribbon-helix-helix protein, copG family
VHKNHGAPQEEEVRQTSPPQEGWSPRRKKVGRPATGKNPLISLRMPQDLIDKIEGWAASTDLSRSEAIRQLIDVALSASRFLL